MIKDLEMRNILPLKGCIGEKINLQYFKYCSETSCLLCIFNKLLLADVAAMNKNHVIRIYLTQLINDIPYFLLQHD